METNEVILISLAIFFLVIWVISSMTIVSYLSNRGVKINYFLLRLMIIPYADQYRKMTKFNNGKTGKLYYVWLLSVNLALACIILRYVI